MNEIRFDIQNSEFGNLVVPIIDGESLITILKEVELLFAKKEGSPRIAGAYDGLPIEMVRLPSEHYYGKSERQRIDNKTELLLCDCLCIGCWDFVALIEVKNNKVIWKNFEQIHRKNWDYSELGTFTFDINQFDSALKEITKN